MENKRISSVCVYCGAQAAVNPKYLQIAREAGELLASQGITLVYGGGGTGMMGALADGALSRGGKVIGVVPRGVARLEGLHQGEVDLRMVETMHARKLTMFELSDAVLVLPGGIGTLDEFFEVFTWKSLGIHEKPIYLLNCEGYWDDLLLMLDGVIEKGFTQRGARELFSVRQDLPSLITG